MLVPNHQLLNELNKLANTKDGTNKEVEDPQLPGQAMSAMEDMQEMNAKSANDLTLEERVKMLSMASSTRSSMKTSCANVPLSL